MIQIHEEIDLVIKQANRFIQYANKKGSYNEFAHDFLRFANQSKIKQDFSYLESWLKDNINTNPDDMLEMILNFDGIMQGVQQQASNVDNEMYNQAQRYWNEAQQNLIDRDLYNAGNYEK